MHRLVHLVTRQWLANKGTICYFAGQALLAVSHHYPYGGFENRAICGAYLAYVHAVLKFEDNGLDNGVVVAKTFLLHRTGVYGKMPRHSCYRR